jgi:hypothetical protein
LCSHRHRLAASGTDAHADFHFVGLRHTECHRCHDPGFGAALALFLCPADQRSTASRSAAGISSVGDSGCPGGREVVREAAGTGTILPQSGHLPNGGGDTALTFNRRPHEQKKRMTPSDGSFDADAEPEADPAAFLCRIRTRAPQPGHTTRSDGSAGIGRVWPQRQIARGIRRNLSDQDARERIAPWLNERQSAPRAFATFPEGSRRSCCRIEFHRDRS